MYFNKCIYLKKENHSDFPISHKNERFQSFQSNKKPKLTFARVPHPIKQVKET